MRAARRTARVFKWVSVLGDISPFWVSEGDSQLTYMTPVVLAAEFALDGGAR